MNKGPLTIGLTYDLRSDYLAAGYDEEETAEFDSPDTIAALEEALCRQGYRVQRIGNIKSLVCLLAAGNRWDMVFNIAEGTTSKFRESQVPAILDYSACVGCEYAPFIKRTWRKRRGVCVFFKRLHRA